MGKYGDDDSSGGMIPWKAGALGITKADMMQSVKSIQDGLTVGVYQGDEKKVPCC